MENRRIGDTNDRILKNRRKSWGKNSKELEKESKRIGERIQKNWNLRKNSKEREKEFKRI